MKKFVIVVLVFLNISIIVGLLGLGFFQFLQIQKLNTSLQNSAKQISDLRTQLSTKSQNTSLQNPIQASSTQTTEPTKKTTPNTVNIYFSKTPDSNTDVTKVSAVQRTTERSDIEVFAIEEYIKGPTEGEIVRGYLQVLKLAADSNCGEKDFTLEISTKGKATLQFCKTIQLKQGLGASSGNTDEARIKSGLEMTLQGLSKITSTTLLTKDKTCIGDNTSTNACLKI
jgi:hypothetical protein